jgi:hypothetical protein
MRAPALLLASALACSSAPSNCPPAPANQPEPSPPPASLGPTIGPTREFEIRDDRAYLGGAQVDLWGIRWGNALMSVAVTERHVRNLDNLAAHGINLIGVYIQGSNGGWPDAEAGHNGFGPDGTLEPAVGERLEWLIREADARGMIVMVGLFSPRKDQQLEGEAAVKRAIEQTARFLHDRELRNVFIDLVHEFDHERMDLDMFREPGGEQSKQRMTQWLHAIDPALEVGVCPTEDSDTGIHYPGMDVTLIQKEMDIPREGYVVNVEMQRHDGYENEGKFEPEEFAIMQGYFEAYRAAENAALLFHSGFTQGITGRSATGPHPEMGGRGASESDRGVRFYFEWVHEHVGRWQYPQHVLDAVTR